MGCSLEGIVDPGVQGVRAVELQQRDAAVLRGDDTPARIVHGRAGGGWRLTVPARLHGVRMETTSTNYVK